MTTDEQLWKAFNKALGLYKLIDEDDRILVGLSGGKDSLMLLDFLARRQKIHVPRFSVVAVHVRMQNIHYETDTTYLHQFCQERGIVLHVVTTSFEEHPEEQPSRAQAHSKQKPHCFLCSWQRRKQMFNLAQQLGCTKIALGHHQDDLIHTALMNLVFQGHFATMPVKLRMRKMPLTIIRPLCLCSEKDIKCYATDHHYEKQLKQCPFEHDTSRTTARQLLERMERLNPEARFSIFHALEASGKLVEY